MSCPDDNKCSGEAMCVTEILNKLESVLEEGRRQDTDGIVKDKACVCV